MFENKPELVEQLTEKVRQGAAAPAQLVTDIVDETAGLLAADGHLRPGDGMISTILALVLSALSVLGVLAFLFPEYLTTPELRQAYNVEWCRALLFGGLLVAGGIGACNLVLGYRRKLNVGALLLVALAIALGGPDVPVGDFPDHTPYLGVDWLILDLLGSAALFVLLEKLFPLYKRQPVFRKEWQTDMVHFVVNHLLVGLMLVIVNFCIHRAQHVVGEQAVQTLVSGIPFLPQLLLCLLVADLAEYFTHRAYHEVPWLWRVHSIPACRRWTGWPARACTCSKSSSPGWRS